MKELRVSIHSLVDVITNSSTEFYVRCYDKTIPFVKDVITAILGEGGSQKTVDDLFDIKIQPDDDCYLLDNIMDEEDVDEEEAKKIMEKCMRDGTWESYLPEDADTQVIIVPKSGDEKAAAMLKKINDLFDVDERAN